MAPTPFRKGLATVKGNGVFKTPTEEEPLVFAPLVGLEEITSADMHEFWDVKPFITFPCIGSKCPACLAGNQPKYKSYMPIVVQGESEPKILPMGISVERMIAAIGEEVGSVKGHVFKLKRTGKGFSTKYTVVPTGKKLDVAKIAEIDVVSNIPVFTADEITAKLTAAGLIEPKLPGAKPKPAPEATAGSETAEEPEASGDGDELWKEA